MFFFCSDSCKKTAVVLKGAIGTVEFINCQSMECQVQAVIRYSDINQTVSSFFFLFLLTNAC